MTFLSHDNKGAGAQNLRWMYLPAAKRVRSIPATRRGDAFFGTDFSYEDVQSELKFKLDDWQFDYGGRTVDGDGVRHTLSGVPKSDRVARELGYGAFVAVIDEETWMPVEIEFADRGQRPLKSIEVSSIQKIDGIWTPGRITAKNHQTQHTTVFEFRGTEYREQLDEQLFDPTTLARGLRALGED
jgi:hypothetical protein